MDLSEIIRVLGRRWLVTVPLILLTVVGVVGGWLVFPTNYTSYAQVTLLPPVNYMSGQNTKLINPFLGLSNNVGLNAAADLFQRSMNDIQSQQALKAMGVTETYSAKLADNASGPFIEIDASGSDPQHLTSSMNTLVSYLQQMIVNIQENPPTGSNLPLNIGPDDMVRSMVYVGVQTPAPATKSKVEKVAMIAVGGILLTLFGGILTENIVRNRSRRAEGPEDEDDDPDGDPDGDAYGYGLEDGRYRPGNRPDPDEGGDAEEPPAPARPAATGARSRRAAPPAEPVEQPPYGYGGRRPGDRDGGNPYEVTRSRRPTPGYGTPNDADGDDDGGGAWDAGRWYHRDGGAADDGRPLSGVDRGRN